MKADRLLSILMILQAKGKTSVRVLPEELEVSVRTIHFVDTRTYLLGMGNSVEVLEPKPLRLSVIDYSRQITEMYDKSRY